MQSDLAIAQGAHLKPITEVGAGVGLQGDDLELYGKYKAKVSEQASERLAEQPDGKLVLVTAINPTPAGEGKTTTSIGLAMGLNRLGHRAVLALREPSLGPSFGIKGGAAGGGYAQVVPMEEINLHFTGDFHAVTSANNLLAAMIDNHLHQGNRLGLDPRSITWRRCLDMNDRALRQIVVGLGGRNGGVPREEGFDITTASEVMAILCLAADYRDLKARLARIIVGYSFAGEPITAGDLGAAGAMAALLKEAMKPNLVQTLENTPALIHGGPFANIAHGCNSIRATRLALKLGDFAVTEAGFGADLGAEKFFDIKCRVAGLQPAVAVLVATLRSLKYNGGVPVRSLEAEDLGALERGLVNLEKHLENLTQVFGVPVVVALNRFPSDTEAEIQLVAERCQALGARFAVSEVWARGGKGGLELAAAVVEAATAETQPLRFAYELDLTIREKIERIAAAVYGAGRVVFTREALRSLRRYERLGLGGLPVCIAKTQYSLSDDPSLLGRPQGFTLTVRELRASAGAGFLVAITGEIMTMPGLPKVPAAEGIDLAEDGKIRGLF